MKDKKFDEALGLLDSEDDMFSTFLRSQILLQNKRPREALVNLTSKFDPSLVQNPGYCNLLIKSAMSLELTLTEMEKMTKSVA